MPDETKTPILEMKGITKRFPNVVANENVDAPDVELAGVVITPELRVATLRLKDSPESLLAFEGQPLEGNYGSWYLSRIEPRQAILQSNSGERVKLELQIHDAMIDEPPKPATGVNADGAEAAERPRHHAQPVGFLVPQIRRAAERLWFSASLKLPAFSAFPGRREPWRASLRSFSIFLSSCWW